MYHILWEYEVRADRVEEFRALYGPTGAWARLFRGAEAYRGTELYCDTSRPTRFVTLDRWTSRVACETFIGGAGDAYARLDREGDELTVHERRVGSFETDGGDEERRRVP